MQLANAIKKLSKFGEIHQNGSLYWATINNHVVEFMRNGRLEDDYGITCIRVRRATDKDDSMIDYFCGVWCDSLTQAIRLAAR